MAYGDGKLLETLYGKSSKYEIFKMPDGFFSSGKIRVYKDEKYWKEFSRLDDAVEAINQAD